LPEIIPDILATLAYFDLFEFPLTEQELYSYLPQSPGYFTFSLALQRMLRDGTIFRIDDFYMLRPDQALPQRRREGGKKAGEMLRTAARISGWLGRFPFVRGVAVSGSLSKHFADENSDIDFFIVTANSRLWIARTALHLFKKLAFLLRRQDYFCMNYFVDEDYAEIDEKNIYTAIEVATLIPMAGENAFNKFFQANQWIVPFLPNRKTPAPGIPVRSKLQRLLERVIGLFGADRLEALLMNTTAQRWNKKNGCVEKNGQRPCAGYDAFRPLLETGRQRFSRRTH